MNNLKNLSKKSGRMILAYKQALDDYIKILETDSQYVMWFKISAKLVQLKK